MGSCGRAKGPPRPLKREKYVASSPVPDRPGPSPRRRGRVPVDERTRSPGETHRGRRPIVIRHRAKLFLVVGAALAVTIPALAQDQPESLLPPGFEEPAPSPTPTP